jgi:V/A-type H+-transporting ATPase subunit B
MNQLYAGYARGKNSQELALVLGESALSPMDVRYVRFAEAFEQQYIQQEEYENRTIEQTLQIGWNLLGMLPKAELKRVHDEYIEQYYKGGNAREKEDVGKAGE